MKRGQLSEERIMGVLREAEGGCTVKVVGAKHNISEPAYCAWKRKHGGMDVGEVRRLRAWEEENGRWTPSRCWRPPLPATEHLRSDNVPCSSPTPSRTGWSGLRSKRSTITSGSPWKNGHIESFHDKLRDECLNRELLGSLLEARVILEAWRIDYKESRPHRSLGYQTPGEFARRSNSGLLTPRAAFCSVFVTI